MTYGVTDLFYYLAVLIFIIGIMYGLSYLIRRFMPGAVPLPRKLSMGKASDQRLEFIESLALHTEDRVFLIRCDKKEYLIYRNAQHVTVIDHLDDVQNKNNNKKKST